MSVILFHLMIIAETERLILRHFHIVDGEAMDRVFGDPSVMYFGNGVQTSEWVRKWLRGCLEDYYQKWGFGLWAVVEKENRETLGFCGLSRFDDVGGQPETEIGYRLARAHWGNGFATEAARAVRDYGFGTLGMTRLISIVDARNIASIRVAEKVGMRFEKDVIFQGFPDRVYAMGRPRVGLV
jgi:ribosomal-protein-alanine N-acetyltransferase